MRLLLLLLLISACASAPVREINTSPYARCAAMCPDGQAFTWENSVDVACFCRRAPVGS